MRTFLVNLFYEELRQLERDGQWNRFAPSLCANRWFFAFTAIAEPFSNQQRGSEHTLKSAIITRARRRSHCLECT